jgi:hypothetical protein
VPYRSESRPPQVSEDPRLAPDWRIACAGLVILPDEVAAVIFRNSLNDYSVSLFAASAVVKNSVLGQSIRTARGGVAASFSTY